MAQEFPTPLGAFNFRDLFGTEIGQKLEKTSRRAVSEAPVLPLLEGQARENPVSLDSGVAETRGEKFQSLVADITATLQSSGGPVLGDGPGKAEASAKLSNWGGIAVLVSGLVIAFIAARIAMMVMFGVPFWS
jgi:hypothetical protein